MIRFIIKRILWMIPILLGILLLVFTISYFTPGDPVLSMLGSNYTEEQYLEKQADLGLDKPYLVRYVLYVKDVVTEFDFGESYMYGNSVGEEMVSRMGCDDQDGPIERHQLAGHRDPVRNLVRDEAANALSIQP